MIKMTLERRRIARVTRAYDATIVQAYCLCRFFIMRPRFLGEIGQYLPANGRILDLGCGFGLFSLYFALSNPNLHIDGVDINKHRIRVSRKAASSLGINNVTYHVGNATELKPENGYLAVYMLDIVHHIPPNTVRGLLERIYASLADDGVLLLKDVAYNPALKRWFTFCLDKVMDPRTPVHYWRIPELKNLLVEVGFHVVQHAMLDFLPYPHVLYVCSKVGARR